jgi:hypothetical protein
MKKRKIISFERARQFLSQFCKKEGIPYDLASKQLCGTGSIGAVLCVSNPDAPEPDGLANDIETLMLPTLYIREDENGELYAVETEYTDQYLRGLKRGVSGDAGNYQDEI